MQRVGFGYDVHRLVAGRKLILGGVAIPFERGLEGHSDADVLSHAIGDALLGAAALGDLGTHFPPGKEEFHNISSLILLQKIFALLNKKNWRIVNIDATIVAQRPKLMAFIQQMRENIASALQIGSETVSVKATTTEGLGFAGTGQGIAAYAVCLIEDIE
ncbi:2-C-methyl-D-erythritol 2,4-cyclodiphosphate synthase [candidate division KSB1 bacterium 4484_87]|nr:MAG: 2-C-methyl-D-erythritol 2,4-cyclodiphosphate synthase [candidate division KSB1 bacterium 4484_87]